MTAPHSRVATHGFVAAGIALANASPQWHQHGPAIDGEATGDQFGSVAISRDARCTVVGNIFLGGDRGDLLSRSHFKLEHDKNRRPRGTLAYGNRILATLLIVHPQNQVLT